MRILDAAAEAPGGAGYELPAQNRVSALNDAAPAGLKACV